MTDYWNMPLYFALYIIMRGDSKGLSGDLTKDYYLGSAACWPIQFEEGLYVKRKDVTLRRVLLKLWDDQSGVLAGN